ncbi:MAG TPA: SAM-dependent methyltransferase [Gammaproteobacteria bacterium]|nr:SAM-dependent methyltransferase [Gammaproteobacteria bacterium]
MIEASIRAERGGLAFDRFMEAALYAPGLGYYAAGARKFGPEGDFVTAPEIGSLFGQCVGQQVAGIFEELGHGVLLEAGPGTGRLMADVLEALTILGALPDAVLLLETSPELRERQQALLRRRLPDYVARVTWLSEWPSDGFEGVVLANEVLDAMPVKRFRVAAGQPLVAHVIHEASGFGWDWHDADTGSATRLIERYALPDDYTTEVNERAPAWIRDLGRRLQRGVLLLIDYGFPGHEYYHSDRRDGTLMCHYRHHAHGDPFSYPGLQDITAHVDFSAIAEAGAESGLRVAGFSSQAGFLLSLGLLERAEAMSDAMAAARQVKYLTLPSEMGELFKVMALSRGIKQPLEGFSLSDRTSAL